MRLEIPLTATHYEALWVARHISIARGWLRQLDRARNGLFYDGHLTTERYERWLRESGVAGSPCLPPRWTTPRARRSASSARGWRTCSRCGIAEWRLFQLQGTPGLISGPGRLVRLDEDGFLVEAHRSGRLLVRIRHSRYWDVETGDACVRRAPGGWTGVEVARGGTVAVTARVGSPRRLGRQPQCPEG